MFDLKAAQPEKAQSSRPPAPKLQRQRCACGGTPGPGGECAACRARDWRPGGRGGFTLRPPHDAFEREAAAAAAEPERDAVAGLVEGSLDDLQTGVGGLAASTEARIRSRIGGGRPLPTKLRSTLEPRLRHDFGRVRIHDDATAAQLADDIGARAFTVADNVFFSSRQYLPDTRAGRRLLTHELTHVAQQGRSPQLAGSIQRDLAIEPPNPAAVAALTAAEVKAAIGFNNFRFKDPYTVRVIRDVLGLEPVPAIIDEEFVRAVAQWQAENNLPVDGKCGADTTRTLIGELAAEGEPADARQLRLDNYVATTDVTAPTFLTDTGAPIQHFVWEVGFRTSLRNGFIIQQIDNEFVPAMCDGTPYVAWRPTPHYWEAWTVDGAGTVTPAIGAINDQWTRPFAPASRGHWRMTGTCFTVLTLPAGAGFGAGNVADAGILQSTAAAPNADDLGLVAGRRTIGGEWNFCAPTNTHVRR
jgi:peptidoglycan hydrolase-like protein with peptidoglycan-binding domain